MEIEMENQTEKIKRFSKVVCVLLNVAVGFAIAAAALVLLAWLWTGAGLPTETVTVNGVAMEAPYLFKLGSVKVLMPVMWRSGFDFSEIQNWLPGFRFRVGFGDFLGLVFTVVGLRYAKKVFVLLREGGSPFRDEIVRALKRQAVVLLIVGFASGFVAFLAAAVVWVLCLIFEHGRALQNEADTTL